MNSVSKIICLKKEQKMSFGDISSTHQVLALIKGNETRKFWHRGKIDFFSFIYVYFYILEGYILLVPYSGALYIHIGPFFIGSR